MLKEGFSIDYKTLKLSVESTPMFQDRSWFLSPQPWTCSLDQQKSLQDIGDAAVAFYRAQSLLYRRSYEGKALTRNQDLKAPWVAEYLDRGKPDDLIQHGRSSALKGQMPVVIRPDLLLTEEGFFLTELDAVPGGIGLTAFLNQLYGGSQKLGFKHDMLMTFYSALANLVDHACPVIAAIISDESETYRPEFEWIAQMLQSQGCHFYCGHPSQIEECGEGVGLRIRDEIISLDIVYRFFELFDLCNIETARILMAASEKKAVFLTPPMLTYQEEKLGLALFHHPDLQLFWQESLGQYYFQTLQKVIPQTWIIEETDNLPPTTVLHGPHIHGKPLRSWMELANLSQRERAFILKISGFHEDAWGARGVSLGSDMNKEEWCECLRLALRQGQRNLYVLQDYKKPMLMKHPRYEANGDVAVDDVRLRLCPYYFASGERVILAGGLATFCPSDKKIIHGMSSAVLVPMGLN